MKGLELYGGETGRQALARASLLLDLVGRQMSVLRSTYPAWDIDRDRDAYGRWWWIALLRPAFTPAMAAAGVRPAVRELDPISLAAALAYESALLASASRAR